MKEQAGKERVQCFAEREKQESEENANAAGASSGRGIKRKALEESATD